MDLEDGLSWLVFHQRSLQTVHTQKIKPGEVFGWSEYIGEQVVIKISFLQLQLHIHLLLFNQVHLLLKDLEVLLVDGVLGVILDLDMVLRNEQQQVGRIYKLLERLLAFALEEI